MKLRNVGKMNYYNDSSRTLLESIRNDNVLTAFNVFIRENDLSDVILIGGLAISYYTKPYMSRDIDILVKDKRKFKYFPNNKYRNGVVLDIYDVNDLGISPEQYDNICKNCIISDNVRIASSSDLMVFLFKNHMNYLRCIDSLFKNCVLNNDIIRKYLTDKEYERFNYYLTFSNKDYCMTFITKYNQFINCRIFEGKTGDAAVDAAFRDWVSGTKNMNQVLIGGLAFINHIPDRETNDVDFIFLSDGEIPMQVNSFKRARPHCFRHIETHVEIETLSPEFLHINTALVDLVFRDAYNKGNYKVASPSSIIVLKLDRFDTKDVDDILKLIGNYQIDITDYIPYLTEHALSNLQRLKNEYGVEL